MHSVNEWDEKNDSKPEVTKEWLVNGVHVLSSKDYKDEVLLMDASDDGPSLFQMQHIDPTLCKFCYTLNILF